MRIKQVVLRTIPDDFTKLDDLVADRPQLVLVFAAPAHFTTGTLATELASRFPDAQRVGCSTAGEISMQGVEDGCAVVTAIHFDHSSLKVVTAELGSMDSSFASGAALAAQLVDWAPSAVLVFGQGVNINGSALVDGMQPLLSVGVAISGGLAGDAGAFQQTFTLCNDGVSSTRVVAIGLKGEALRCSHGSVGGWRPFGRARKVTRCDNNVLYELDGEPALNVYKRYLGGLAEELPQSGLLFPFEMLTSTLEPTGVIRTILGVNEAEGSLTLAGAMIPDGYVRLMHAHTDALVDGAEKAALLAHGSVRDDDGPGLALLVSCVGRKLVMGGRVDDEVEVVRETFGPQAMLAGFYSYGEISPEEGFQACRLHNQTMTISYITEVSV